jgi:magnesium transporter
MFKLKRVSKKAGLPPGTLVHIGEKRVEKIKITLIDYNETQFQEREVKTVEECFPFKDTPTVTWINIDGIHDVDFIEKLGTHFDLHPLILEDIVNTEQRPKMEDMGNYIFTVLKMLDYNKKKDEISAEQVSLVLGPNFVISFHESESETLDPVRERIGKAKGRIRKMGADYLTYAIIDCIVDNYFAILETIGEAIEDAEKDLVKTPTSETLQSIHKLKGEIISLRKATWPLREIVSGLEKAETPLIRKTTKIYLRDVYDHTIQVIDSVESHRDIVSGMLDIYLSSVSNRMNEVMKVLTIFAAIFIPLTFIAGVYGMNFAFMPELTWRWGYPLILIIMVLAASAMLVYFKRKNWL